MQAKTVAGRKVRYGVIEAIWCSLTTGQPQYLAPYNRSRRIELDQKETLNPTKPYRYVNASNPTEG